MFRTYKSYRTYGSYRTYRSYEKLFTAGKLCCYSPNADKNRI